MAETPKKMKFEALTTTKGSKSFKKITEVKEKKTVELVKPSLQLQLDEKGLPNNIEGVLSRLPDDVKTLIETGNIISIKSTHSLTYLKLDNRLSIKISEKMIGKKHTYVAEIKQGKKTVFNKQIKL